jgi:diguanylate cyclase (GGDEF)-like protein
MLSVRSIIPYSSIARACGKPRGDRAKRWWTPLPLAGIAAGVIGFVLSCSASFVVSNWENRLGAQEFSTRANSQALLLQNGIDKYMHHIEALRALFESSNHGLDRREFATFSEFLLRDQTAMLAVSWIPRITRDQREAHERAAAAEGLRGYRIKNPAMDGSVAVAAEASEYFPIFYSSSQALDLAVYGLNLNDGGMRQRTLERARDENRIATTPKFMLPSVDGDQNGFFVLLPVYRPGLPHDTLEDRRGNLVGFVQGVFQIGVMIETILNTTTAPAGLDLYFFGPDSGGGAPPIYFHPSRTRKVATGPTPPAELMPRMHWSGSLNAGDSLWTILAAPVPGGVGTASHLSSWMALIGGLSISTIVVAYFGASARSAQHLRAANDQLDRTNGALDTANEHLLAQNTRFDTALNNMSHGLLMFDAAERIVVCNDRYIEMYGLSPEIVKPGLSLIELLRYRVATGHLNRDAEQYRSEILAALAEKKATNFITEMADGRETLAAATPMAGGGWVVTHEDITERRSAEAKISYMAHHDALTRLANRLMFHNELQQAVIRAKRGERLAVLCLDLDRFKSVNDTLGHPIGDRLLTVAADRLRQCVRDNDIVARLGGDEFAIVQTGSSEPTDATALAERLIDTISAPYDLDGHQVVVGLSIGIAVAPNDGLDPDQLLRNADIALYRAKADGRGAYRFFEPEMDARMQARRTLELDLRKAIANGEFELFYQPQVDVQTQRVNGFEALIRWRHPQRRMVSPSDFIGVAEDSGLIVSLGAWVLQQACTEAATWPRDIKVAVNLSPVQFNSKNLLPVIVSALAKSGLSPRRLELEITESVLLQDSDATLTMLHQMRDLGLKIAMDDFGTGYSSLSYLRKFPFDKIKIDQSFIRDISGDDSLAIVRAVIAIGTSLGIVTTAEGVETFEQFEQLKLEGCNEVQGYLFSPPRPPSEVKELLSRLNTKLKVVA